MPVGGLDPPDAAVPARDSQRETLRQGPADHQDESSECAYC